jgi:hypothetical protein
MFSLKNYLAFNTKKGSLWKCPECNKRSVLFRKDPMMSALIEAVKKY